jgi:sec-independent protein translocase protein TatA
VHAHLPRVHAHQEETMFGLGFGELVVILLIVIVLFGAKRLPELGDGLGRFVRGLRTGLQDDASNKPLDNNEKKT